MDDRPSVVVLTLHDKENEDIVKGVLSEDVLPTPTIVQDGIQSWCWEIRNKYYTADIQLATVKTLNIHKQWILSSCEALIIYCNSTQTTALEDLNSLHESLGDFEPDVQLLVCDTCSSEDSSPGLSRLKAQQWCISNRWELIELNKIEDEDSGNEDDFPESWGFQRIRQALHAHTWSNLEMNDTSKSSSLNAVMQSVVSMEDKKSENVQSSSEVMYSRLEDLSLLDSEIEDSRLQGDSDTQVPENGMNSSALEDYLEKGEGDFEKLFTNFEHMKRTAASLPPEHRRDYAERVAISFWKAIGGPDEELDGLDSD